MRKDYTEAIEACEAFVAERTISKDGRKPEVSIYTYGEDAIGIRVSEVSCWWPNETGRGGGGCSWMRSDLDGTEVLLAAENFILNYGYEPEDHGDGMSFDPEQESQRGLAYHLAGGRDNSKEAMEAMGEWKERV